MQGERFKIPIQNRIQNQRTNAADQQRVVKGSFTVEAALIMPMIFYLIFSICYLSFYLHDINRIQGLTDKALHRTGLIIKHEANLSRSEINYADINERGVFYIITGKTDKLEDRIRQYIIQEISEGLFLMKVTDIDLEVGKFYLDVKVKAETEIAMKGVLSFFRPSKQKVIEGRYTIHNPADTLRMSEVILNTGSKVKGVEELKNIIGNVIDLVK